MTIENGKKWENEQDIKNERKDEPESTNLREGARKNERRWTVENEPIRNNKRGRLKEQYSNEKERTRKDEQQ